MRIKTTYHRSSTSPYRSVYRQLWVRRADSVPDEELAAMSGGERERVLRHLSRAHRGMAS